MAGTTWTKFYWSDWMSDAQLRRCSPAARALWMDMLCIAAQHDPVGFVAVRGQPLQPDEIARMTGFSAAEVTDLLAQLERNGVYSRDRQRRIYSRRMVRDAQRSQEGRKSASKRWSQDTEKKEKKSPPNRGATGGPKTHIPEAISQSRDNPDSAALDGCARSPAVKSPEVQIRSEIMAIIGDEMPPGDMNRAAMWLAQGYPPDLIRAVVVERIRAGKRPSSLAWFDKSLAEAAAVKAPKLAKSGPDDDAWRLVMRRWLSDGVWHPAFGPPGGSDCPAHIKAEFERAA